jgi:hypothetical protein
VKRNAGPEQMARGKSPIQASAVKRVVAALMAKGLRVRGVEVKEGGFVVLTNSVDAASNDQTGKNEWDSLK